MSRWLYAVRIEGLGDVSASTASDKRWRWSWGSALLDDAASQDPDGLYVDSGGVLQRYPRELSFSLDFRTGDARSGGITFELRRTATVLSTLMAGIPGVTARLESDLSATATSIVLDTTGLSSGLALHIGRECLILGAESPSGTYAVTRAQLGTRARAHTAGEPGELFTRMHPSSLAGRLIDLIRVPLSGTYTDEEVLWRGVLNRPDTSSLTSITFGADDILTYLRQVQIYRNPFTATIGTAEQPGRQVTGFPDGGQGATVTNPAYCLAMVGDRACKAVYYASTDGEGTSSVGPFGAFLGVYPEDVDRGTSLREFFSTHPDQPSNSASPSTNTLPLSQDPGKCPLQLLLTSPNGGSPGANSATYDTGIDNLAGDLHPDTIDITAWEFFGVRHALEPLDQLHIGNESASPVRLYDLIGRRVLRPRGATWGLSSGSKLRPTEIADALTCGTDNTLVESQVVNVVRQHWTVDEAVGEVRATYNLRPGLEPDILTATDVGKVSYFPGGEYAVLDGPEGLDAGATADLDIATLQANRWVSILHAPTWVYELDCLSTADYWPGDVVSLTHGSLMTSPPGASAAVVGISSGICLVIGRRVTLDDTGHLHRLTLWYVGEPLQGASRCWCPTAEVASWDGGTNTATVQANSYTDASLGPVNTDAAAFTVGDEVAILDEHGVVQEAALTITAISGNDITIDAPGGALSAGDIIVPTIYASATSAQRAAWGYIADSTPALDGDDPHRYATG